MVEKNDNKLGGYMPKEVTEGTEKAKLIEPPKKMSSKDAWMLQQTISEQLTSSFTSPLAEPGCQKTKRL